MNARDLSAILLTLAATAFGWVAIIVGVGLAVAWVFGGWADVVMNWID